METDKRAELRDEVKDLHTLADSFRKRGNDEKANELDEKANILFDELYKGDTATLVREGNMYSLRIYTNRIYSNSVYGRKVSFLKQYAKENKIRITLQNTH